MNFSFDDDQQALTDLAKQVFRDAGTPERLRAAESTEGFDAGLWSTLAAAGLLGACLPEPAGGGGLDTIALCSLLEQAGAQTAAVPLFGALVLGAWPLAQAGVERERLSRFAAGRARLTGAYAEPGSDDLDRPLTTVVGGRLTGTKTSVQDATAAECFVVSATGDEGPGVYLVEAEHARVERQVGTDDRPLGLVSFDGAPASRFGDAAALADALDLGHLALCAMTLGAAHRAMIMTAKYTAERQQFERPIATFQAVAQRAGDMYVDVEMMRVVAYRAAWLRAAGLPATREIAVARALCCGAGHRVLTAAQHLHGGTGFDRDYPLYRLYLAAKQWEFTHGGGNSHFARLGDLLVAAHP